MRRIAFAILGSAMLLILGLPVSAAKAGDVYYGDRYRHRYYDDGYRPRYRRNVWYSSSCCYRKVVRHERRVRYVRVAPRRPYYYRHGYYDRPHYQRPWRRYGYDHRPYRDQTYYDVPPRYVDYPYERYRRGYDAYNAVPATYADTCTRRRVPYADGRGGWVWAVKTVCY
jgi:hypothetical protein